MAVMPPFNLKQWINNNRDLLKPPVGNTKVYDDGDFIIIVVGGPNKRKDYHFNHGAEFFYQLEGDVSVKIFDEGEPKEIHIKEGDVFLLPAEVPHSPQRPANTVGLVIERKRKEDELDAFQWYCENCGNMLYSETLPLLDIVTQLPPLFDKFWASEEKRTCSKCSTVMQPPAED